MNSFCMPTMYQSTFTYSIIFIIEWQIHVWYVNVSLLITIYSKEEIISNHGKHYYQDSNSCLFESKFAQSKGRCQYVITSIYGIFQLLSLNCSKKHYEVDIFISVQKETKGSHRLNNLCEVTKVRMWLNWHLLHIKCLIGRLCYYVTRDVQNFRRGLSIIYSYDQTKINTDKS